jgi:hypothetical protein
MVQKRCAFCGDYFEGKFDGEYRCPKCRDVKKAAARDLMPIETLSSFTDRTATDRCLAFLPCSAGDGYAARSSCGAAVLLRKKRSQAYSTCDLDSLASAPALYEHPTKAIVAAVVVPPAVTLKGFLSESVVACSSDGVHVASPVVAEVAIASIV